MSKNVSNQATCARRKYRKLASAEWDALLALYSTGSTTLAELAETYGVSIRSIQLHLSKSGTVKGEGAQEVAHAARERVLSRALPKAEAVAERIRAAKDAALTDAAAIQTLIRQTLEEAASGAVPLSVSARIRLADQAAHSLERVHRLQRVILGMDKENQASQRELPELPIRELTESEVAQIRADQQRFEDGIEDELAELDGEPETISEGE